MERNGGIVTRECDDYTAKYAAPGQDSYGLYSYGLYSYGLYSHGLYSYGLYRYGLYSYGLYSYGLLLERRCGHLAIHTIYLWPI